MKQRPLPFDRGRTDFLEIDSVGKKPSRAGLRNELLRWNQQAVRRNIKPNFFRSTGGHYHDCDLSHPKEDTVNKPVHTPEQFGTILARKRPNNHSKASKRDHSRNSREQRHKHHEPWDDAQGRSDLALAHNSRITGHVKRNAAHSLPHKVGCQERYHVGTDDQAQCVLPLNNDPNDRHSHRHIHETYSNVR